MRPSSSRRRSRWPSIPLQRSGLRGGDPILPAGASERDRCTLCRAVEFRIGVLGKIGRHIHGIAFANNSSETRRVLLELFLRSGGEQKLRLEIDLPPHAHLARLLTELFPKLASGQALLRYSSDAPVGFLAMRICHTARGDQPSSSVDLGNSAGSGEQLFPQLAVGGGYEMRYVVLNPGDTYSRRTPPVL